MERVKTDPAERHLLNPIDTSILVFDITKLMLHSLWVFSQPARWLAIVSTPTCPFYLHCAQQKVVKNVPMRIVLSRGSHSLQHSGIQ